MPFPYLTPFLPWITDILQEREDNQVSNIFKNPYAMITSAALVVQGAGIASNDEKTRAEDIENKIKNPPPESYKGCIIANNINSLALSYSTAETIVGIDFDGKPIKVANGETGRKVSTPIIESITMDSGGTNAALKSAKVTVRCFTLKQFEMFELFFMKPGMSVIVEWGDSTILTTKPKPAGTTNGTPVTNKRSHNTFQNGTKVEVKPFKDPSEALIINQDGNKTYDTFCKNFSKYFRSDTTAIAKYLERIENSLGSYDLVAGKVLDYSFSINEDGTYSCNFEVSQGNQINMAIPCNPTKDSSKEKTKSNDVDITKTTQIIEQIASDFNLDSDIFKQILKDKVVEHADGTKETDWSRDWFNFLKINKLQKDTVASSDAYISLRFILVVLMNYVLYQKDGKTAIDTDFFELTLPVFKIGNKKVEVIPVTSNRYMISSSPDIIFPTDKLPMPFARNPKGKDFKEEDNKITIPDDPTTKDGKINGYNFHLSNPLQYNSQHDIQIPSTQNSDYRLGDALSIFIKYETVVKAWRKSYTRIDFLEQILGTVNDASYGLFRLVYGLQDTDGKPTVVDYKLAPPAIQTENNNTGYRFKPTTIKSIVKQFSFNFEMSNLVAGRTIFNSSKFLDNALQKSNAKNINGEIPLPPDAYKSIDNSSFGNADGYYSINNVELLVMKEKFQQAQALRAKNIKEEDPKKEATKEAQDLNDVIKNKSIKFLMNPVSPKDPITLIYTDSTLIQNKIHKSEKDNADKTGKKKSTLSPIEVTITIDGFSGFRCGQYFNIDGVPEIYNQIGVFQITEISHSVQKSEWTTTIKADFRIMNK